MKKKNISVLITILFVVISGIIYSGMRGNVVGSETVDEFSFGSIKVDVGGAVFAPGVYSLNFDARAEDAVKAAGGLLSDADESFVNMADFLSDGQKLYIPYNNESLDEIYFKTGANPFDDEDSDFVININEAGVFEFTLLPGIGGKTAKSIVDYRNEHGPFKSKEELLNVSGIGEGRLTDIWDYITVD